MWVCMWVQVMGVYVGDGWVKTNHLHSGSFRELAEELQGEKDEARILPYLRQYLYFCASKASKVRRESGVTCPCHRSTFATEEKRTPHCISFFARARPAGP